MEPPDRQVNSMGRGAATTDENTVVLLADFYRAGDGNDESFTAQMIVSADDIVPRRSLTSAREDDLTS
jgi:hypothetical protein